MKNFITIGALFLALTTFGQKAETQKQAEMQTNTRIQNEVKSRAQGSIKDGQSNEKFPQSQRVEDAYPLSSDESREKVSKLMQQTTVDLLSMFNQYKEAHWNVNGPLYLSLHDYYQEQADYYRAQADIFAERALQLGFSIDGRYSTIAKTSKIPDFPAGYITDNESLKLLIDRTTILQKEIYNFIKETNDIDPIISNKLQDLGYNVDKNLWKLRIHLQKPGSDGENLPWSTQQGRDRTK
ncbi:MAG: DNA starvation/stationary phase protection protein [Chitinophagaceae bacterium]